MNKGICGDDKITEGFMMEKIRIAIAGAGNIAQSAHLPAYQKRDDVEIVAICDLNLARAKACAEKFGIPKAFASAEEMIRSVPCDVVDICVWNRAHSEIAVLAAEAGRHILCEKPMALNVSHALRMKEAVEKSGVTFMMAMPRRFLSDVEYLHQRIAQGELGDIYYAKTSMIRRRGTPIGWFTDTQKSGGGPVIDIGVHAIDCAWYLMGRPKPVRVSASTSYAIGDFTTKGVSRWKALDSDVTAFDTEDSAAGMFTFANGATLLFEVSWALNTKENETTILCGSKGGSALDMAPGAKDPFVLYTEENDFLLDKRPTLLAVDPFEQEIDYFLACLRSGTKPDASLEDGITMIRMLMGIYDSAREGREVTL